MSTFTHTAHFCECPAQLLLIDKPFGWTSFDVVAKIRNAYTRAGFRCKVGHAGTLDPRATGLLLLATGKKTKEIAHLETLDKTYSGCIKLGAQTPSYDSETEEQDHRSTDSLSLDAVLDAASHFTGKILQLPPMYSAVWYQGRRLYDLARAGQVVADRKAREVEIFEFSITDFRHPFVYFRARVSKGTYIRTLAHDFGQALGVGGYLYALRRERIGVFDVAHAHPLEHVLAEIAAAGTSLQQCNAH
jgi:tRNA pseudouridine55 synthase